MNYLDILALLIIFISVVTAVVKGLVKELFSLASAIMGLFLAVAYYPDFFSFLRALGMPEDLTTEFLAFILIFAGTLFLGAMVSANVNMTLTSLHLEWVDRIFGGIFGLLRGYLINAVIFLALTVFKMKHDLLVDSRLAEFFLAGARIVIIFIPEDLKTQFLEAYDWLMEAW